MIEQYDKEISQIHASPELIQKTKVAMRLEEDRIYSKGESAKAENRWRLFWTGKRKSNI